MLIPSQNFFTFSPSRFNLYYATSIQRSASSRFSFLIASECVKNFSHSQIPKYKLRYPLDLSSFGHQRYRLGVFESEGVAQREISFGDFSFDYFLSIAELLCLVSVAVISIGFSVTHALSDSTKTFPAVNWEKNLVFGILLLVCGVAIGAWIRRRQWRLISGQSVNGVVEANLVRRIDKLEGDLRSSSTLMHTLSRQLQKLGIRIKVFRKALKDPIAETAALAHRNSEATRALALLEEIMEKELAEIQMVLLAMQEQQQKQLELILAIGKMGKMMETRHEVKKESIIVAKHESADKNLKQREAHQL